MLEQPLGRLAVELSTVLDHLESAPEPGEHRQAAGEPEVERVDGLDAQAARIPDQVPAPGPIGRQRARRELERALLPVPARRAGRGRLAHRTEDPAAHLCGRLAGESDRQHRFRLAHRREQTEESLAQQFRLAGAGRRLDDEAATDVERTLPRRRIRTAELTHRRRPSRPQDSRRPGTMPAAGSGDRPRSGRRRVAPRRCKTPLQAR